MDVTVLARTLGRRARERRLAEGVTQKGLVESAGVTVIAPGVGTVIGAAMGKKGKKLELACRDCGYRWTQKK